MERKDYAEKFLAVKNEILEEIRKILGYDQKHEFKETFYIHYVEGEVATTEICNAIEIDKEGMVIFNVVTESLKKEKIEAEAVFMYDPESFLDILDNLKKEVRENKLQILREIVKANNGHIEFDGNFKFTGDDGDGDPFACSTCESCSLLSIKILDDGKLEIEDEWEGEIYNNTERFLIYDELDRIINYVKKRVCRKFVIRVSGSFSRTFDIEASSYEEALEEAKKDWEINPLRYDDSNGEDWEDYTKLAH